MQTLFIKDKKFVELYSETELNRIVMNCVNQIRSSIRETENLILIGVLNGGIPLMNEIAFNMPENIMMDYVKAVSYGDSTFSSGEVNLLLDSCIDLKGKDILLVDDIIDTGRTISFLTEHFISKGAESVRTCCLFYKQNQLVKTPDFYGTEIDEKFIIGFGLDYAQKGRNLRKILKLSD